MTVRGVACGRGGVRQAGHDKEANVQALRALSHWCISLGLTQVTGKAVERSTSRSPAWRIAA